jgi:hypothetical protein
MIVVGMDRPAPAAEETLGLIRSIDFKTNELILESHNGHVWRFQIDSDTKVGLNGAQSDIAALRKGDVARVSYETTPLGRRIVEIGVFRF